MCEQLLGINVDLPQKEKMLWDSPCFIARTLSNYIVWSVIQDEVPYLSTPFLHARMHYKEKILGSKGLRKRWKTCVSYTNEYLGELLGKLYVKDHFAEKSKTLVSAVSNSYLFEAFMF